MPAPGENLQPHIDQVTNVKSQAIQLQEKIKAKEAELGKPISYSIGKGDSEVVILAQPLHQEVEAVWNGDKTRPVRRERYIAVGTFGIGAVDFVKAARFDSSDNIPERNDGIGLPIEGITYDPEGQWVAIPESDGDNGRSEKGFLRNIQSLGGVDKQDVGPFNGLDTQVIVAGHDHDGFNLSSDGTPHIRIGHDFSAQILQEGITSDEFSQAIKASIESSKPVELKTDNVAQTNLLNAAMASF